MAFFLKTKYIKKLITTKNQIKSTKSHQSKHNDTAKQNKQFGDIQKKPSCTFSNALVNSSKRLQHL
jgi:hypothetical protein